MDSPESEARAIEDVFQRLRPRFPHLTEADVRSVVQRAYASVDGPVRSYVPLLVEHRARDDLRALSGHRGAPLGAEQRAGLPS